MDHINFQIPGTMPPPVNHPPPPQVFGAYGPDGLPQAQLPPELAAQMFPDSGFLFDESQDAKRRRIARVSTHTRPCVRALRARVARKYKAQKG